MMDHLLLEKCAFNWNLDLHFSSSLEAFYYSKVYGKHRVNQILSLVYGRNIGEEGKSYLTFCHTTDLTSEDDEYRGVKQEGTEFSF